MVNLSITPDRLQPRLDPGHHMRDEFSLGERIRLTIVGMTSGEIALEFGVLVCNVRMVPLVVTKQDAVPL